MFPRNGGAFVGTRLSELLVVLRGRQKGGSLMVVDVIAETDLPNIARFKSLGTPISYCNDLHLQY